jgi:hypothetical protein
MMFRSTQLMLPMSMSLSSVFAWYGAGWFNSCPNLTSQYVFLIVMSSLNLLFFLIQSAALCWFVKKKSLVQAIKLWVWTSLTLSHASRSRHLGDACHSTPIEFQCYHTFTPGVICPCIYVCTVVTRQQYSSRLVVVESRDYYIRALWVHGHSWVPRHEKDVTCGSAAHRAHPHRRDS